MIGELDAGNPHVQFDEGAQETCDIAARLCPTLRQARFCAQLRDAVPFGGRDFGVGGLVPISIQAVSEAS